MKLEETLAAIRDDNVPKVRRLLEEDAALAKVAVPRGAGQFQTLLHVAAPGDGAELTEARLSIVRLLLDAGLPVDELGDDDNHGRCTAMTRAAWGGHVPLVRLLLEYGADPDGHADGFRHQPVTTAAYHGHAGAVRELVAAGARHSLLELILAGMEAKVVSALDGDAGLVNRPLQDESLPLHLALSTPAGRELVPLLLRRGADPHQTDSLGRNAIHVAVEQGQQQYARQLRGGEAEADIFTAAALGDEELVRQCLERDPKAAQRRQNDGLTPLFYAVWAGSLGCAELLLNAGADASAHCARLWACLTPLHVAIQQRHREIMHLLLERGADVNAYLSPSHPGYWPTPLHAAARRGKLQDMAALLDKGADLYGGSAGPDVRDSGVLGWLLFSGDARAMQLLLDRGMQLDHPRCVEALREVPRQHGELIALLREHGWGGIEVLR